MIELFDTTTHPLGGTIHWYRNDAHTYTILDTDYPYANDCEIQERNSLGDTIPNTERRAPSLEEAITLLGTLE